MPFAAGLALALLVPLARGGGDGYAGPGEWVTLFAPPPAGARPDALGLPAEKLTAARAVAAEYREALREQSAASPPSAEARAALLDRFNGRIQKIFTESERERIRRFLWHEQAGAALLDPELARRLEITAAQAGQLREIKARHERARREAYDRLPRATAEYVQELDAGLKQRESEELLAVLSPAQRERWEQLQREP